MIRHVVMLKWKPETTQAEVETLRSALAELPALVPSIVDYAFGTDLGSAPTNFDFAVSAVFHDLDGYVTYRDHPEHVRVVQAFIAPHLAERAAVQFALD
jgi:hypothetical protein